MADVAEDAGATPRALQLSLRRHLGTSPMAHLRVVRLEPVRHALTLPHPGSGTTASRLAAEFNFADYCPFTALYRRRFAESPVETLRH